MEGLTCRIWKILAKSIQKNLSCIMKTYPGTYGLFDREILAITSMVHYDGGQCYIDGANMNAMVGYTAPGCIGGDVCQINLHKTFSFPHGGGGPGMGPIAVRQHLVSFLPDSVFLFKTLVVPSLLVKSLKQHTDRRLFFQFLIY
ncbi:glycine dehydrogenase [Trypanosoma cruzi]|nr:glycine dehydrogenase [Trypanosoma cruzi]